MPTVQDIYRQVLGRDADPAGLAMWSAQFGADVDAAELAQFTAAAQAELAVQRQAAADRASAAAVAAMWERARAADAAEAARVAAAAQAARAAQVVAPSTTQLPASVILPPVRSTTLPAAPMPIVDYFPATRTASDAQLQAARNAMVEPVATPSVVAPTPTQQGDGLIGVGLLALLVKFAFF